MKQVLCESYMISAMILITTYLHGTTHMITIHTRVIHGDEAGVVSTLEW